MGDFATVAEVQRLTLVDWLKELDPTVVEERFVLPAENLIEEACNLDLNTDRIPYEWEAIFDTYPRRLADFKDDYRRAVLILCDRMATNPHDYASQTVAGGGASFRSRIPREVFTLMSKWGRGRKVFRA